MFTILIFAVGFAIFRHVACRFAGAYCLKGAIRGDAQSPYQISRS